ncbi:MAG TPA: UDP-3-O-(3-hydroxymyristoyl)glucosamine N-acyltransferase [Gammaproteobacteria bacterium]|nr:UDP-3-O-(3-hydroxymyristoyl)glucosamine N-acyltransferase [Gammaproteobacteria bacterium]
MTGDTSFTLATLAERLNGKLSPRASAAEKVTSVATLAEAQPGQIAFFSHPRYRKELLQTRASCVLIHAKDVAGLEVPHMCVADPYLAYARVAQWLNPISQIPSGRGEGCVVAEGSRIDPSVYLGAHVVVGRDVEIHANCAIGAGTVIGDGTVIGANSRIYANVTLYDHTILGQDVTIHSGCVIGADGFGFAPSAEGWVKIPQLGRVRIGDRCNIGANTTIDRGALEDTILGEGVILDNQIQIAHNVTIGDFTAIAGCSAVAGSTHIGKNCLIAGGVRIVGHLTITDSVQIEATSLVTKSISKKGTYSSALAARSATGWKKQLANLNRLNKLVGRLTRLEKQVKE